MAILGLNYDFADPGSVLIWGWSCESAEIGYNRARWCNQDFDDAIYAAKRTADPAEQERLYLEAGRVFDQEKPAAMLAYSRLWRSPARVSRTTSSPQSGVRRSSASASRSSSRHPTEQRHGR
jgi:ABC-type oligopeptide transport system substrate-binding subunit